VGRDQNLSEGIILLLLIIIIIIILLLLLSCSISVLCLNTSATIRACSP
jgi:hypothetical protein